MADGEEVPEKTRVNADTAFNGVLDAHNLLVDKVVQLSQELKDLKKTSAESHEEHKKDLANKLEAFEADLGAKGKALKTVEEKLQSLEKSGEAERTSLRHAIDEISNHQAEIKSRILPDWEKGLVEIINKLRQDLIEIQGGLNKRLAEAEEATKKLQEILDKDEGFKMAGLLQSQVNSLEAFVKNQDQIVLAAYNSRLDNLEAAVRHSDYERGALSERVGQDLQVMSQHLRGFSSLLTDISKHLESSHEDTSGAGLQKVQLEVDSLKEVTSKLRQDFQVRSEKSEQTHASNMAHLGSRLESKHSDVEKLKFEVERLSKSTEIERIKRLETKVEQEREERRSFITRFEKEEHERKESWQSWQQSWQKTELGQVHPETVDFLRKDLEDLKLDFKSLLMSEDQRVMDAARLEALVRALEDRVWPWRKGARSRSPTRSPSPGPPVTVEVELPSSNPWEWRETQRPMGPRWYQDLPPSTGLPAVGRGARRKDRVR